MRACVLKKKKKKSACVQARAAQHPKKHWVHSPPRSGPKLAQWLAETLTSSRMKKGEGEQACMEKRSAREAMDFSPPDRVVISRNFFPGGWALNMIPPSASKGSEGLDSISLALPPMACIWGKGGVERGRGV